KIILVDRSVGMLKAAKKRISRATNSHYLGRISFMQADIFELPFPKNSFTTVLSMGMLHLFEDASKFVHSLLNLIADGGQLYLTSLVTDRLLGKKYLSFLHQIDEVAQPRSFHEVYTLVKAASNKSEVEAKLEGNMAFLTVSKAV